MSTEFSLFDICVILSKGQDHSHCYQHAEFSGDHNHAKFERYQFQHVQLQANIMLLSFKIITVQLH